MDKFSYCEAILEENSPLFHKAFSLLEAKKAQAVYAVFAFCRTADDAIDVDNDIEKVNTLKKHVKSTFEGDVPKEPLFEALYETIMRYPSTVSPYLDLLDGMRDDYYQKPIKTEAEFDEYCFKAAGTLGLMLMPVLASEKQKTETKQVKKVMTALGKAMQITNILRDVRDDFMKDRIYFPEEIFEQYQINLETLRTGLITAEWRALNDYYISMARGHYQLFYDNIALLDQDAQYPTYLAARFYEGILDHIEKSDYTNLHKQHKLSNLKQFFITKRVKKALKQKGLM
ncbi:MAG: squalene/phytoene synthase family protein [Acholeplasmatales bacterium]|nr:MAG: squalene/phytoene synthase family protein [Acholeplasmatales bacterium]